MTEPNLPPVSNFLQRGFHRYLHGALRRHFHAIAVDRKSRCESLIGNAEPLIVYGNHPGWWDPLVAHFLNRSLFSSRQFYAPIDAEALEKYRVLGRLGFYAVEMQSTRGAATFLKRSKAILDVGHTSVWITPEGRFADPRDHTAELMPGLTHLCTRLHRGWVLPMVMEYAFWDERLPLCLSRMGTPIRIADLTELSKTEVADRLTAELREAQSLLAAQVIHRDSEPFDLLLSGRRGGGVFYDSCRRVGALVSGRKFEPQHGEQFR